jgi:hypothetical protein
VKIKRDYARPVGRFGLGAVAPHTISRGGKGGAGRGRNLQGEGASAREHLELRGVHAALGLQARRRSCFSESTCT